MTRRIRLSIVLAAVLALWAGFAWTVSRPDDFADYSRTVGQVAGSTHDAARTGWLTGQQQLAGRLTAAFAAASYDDAGKGLAGARKQFAQAVPPDDRSRSLRDQLSPLLAETERSFGDAAGAADRAALAAAVERLEAVSRSLEEFIEAQR